VLRHHRHLALPVELAVSSNQYKQTEHHQRIEDRLRLIRQGGLYSDESLFFLLLCWAQGLQRRRELSSSARDIRLASLDKGM